MLAEFIQSNREEIIRRARAQVALRPAPRPTEHELTNGVPLFLDQLVARLRIDASTEGEISETATAHGGAMLRGGFSVAQVVQGYGDVCQAVTTLALQHEATIRTEDFKTLNESLDTATADAVSEFERQRDRALAGRETERLGFMAHELRNHLTTAMMAFDILSQGKLAIGGSTGAALRRSLGRLRDTIERALAEVRLDAGVEVRERLLLADLVEEVELSATFEANHRGISFAVERGDGEAYVLVDRHILASALGNLLQNAFKFTARAGKVTLRTRTTADRVAIEVEDECGGLPEGGAEALFRPFEQRSVDRTGLGLGLAITRRGIEANAGTVRVRDLPGRGCVFTVDLPRA